MVNKKAAILTSEESEGEESSIVEMQATMDDLRCQNQASEDNVLHIKQRQQKVEPTNYEEMLDLQPLSYEIWKVPVLENFKSPSLAKF